MSGACATACTTVCTAAEGQQPWADGATADRLLSAPAELPDGAKAPLSWQDVQATASFPAGHVAASQAECQGAAAGEQPRPHRVPCVRIDGVADALVHKVLPVGTEAEM